MDKGAILTGGSAAPLGEKGQATPPKEVRAAPAEVTFPPQEGSERSVQAQQEMDRVRQQLLQEEGRAAESDWRDEVGGAGWGLVKEPQGENGAPIPHPVDFASLPGVVSSLRMV